MSLAKKVEAEMEIGVTAMIAATTMKVTQGWVMAERVAAAREMKG